MFTKRSYRHLFIGLAIAVLLLTLSCQLLLPQGPGQSQQPTPQTTLATSSRQPCTQYFGQIVYIRQRHAEASNADYFNVYRMNPDGTGATAVTNDSYSDFNPAWSPDHCQIAFYSHRGEHDENIYVIAPDGTGLRRLTDNTGVDRMPTWSPDGTRIAYISGRNGQLDLYVMNVDGKNPRQLTNTPEDDRDPEWSPADNRIVYEQLGGENHGIWVADADQGTPRMLTPKSPSEVSYLWPTWSPDGTRIACVTNVTIRQSREIAILNADGTGTQSSLMLPEEYGSPEFLSWSPDGKSIVHYNTVVHCPGCGGDEDIVVIEIASRQITNLTDRPDGPDRDPDW